MRQISYTKRGKTGLHECRIKVDDEKKLILWSDCTCWNFTNKRILKSGKLFLTKYSQRPCKHLEPVYVALIKQGYNLNIKGINDGEDKCSTKLRNVIIRIQDNKCITEGCNKTENLQIHRLTAGYLNGKYSLTNCVALCPDCHRLRHYGEFT